MITAILDAGFMKGKIKQPKITQTIEMIPMMVPQSTYFTENPAFPKLTTTPIMIFTWWKQISKYTHIYKLKEIK